MKFKIINLESLYHKLPQYFKDKINIEEFRRYNNEYNKIENLKNLNSYINNSIYTILFDKVNLSDDEKINISKIYSKDIISMLLQNYEKLPPQVFYNIFDNFKYDEDFMKHIYNQYKSKIPEKITKVLSIFEKEDIHKYNKRELGYYIELKINELYKSFYNDEVFLNDENNFIDLKIIDILLDILKKNLDKKRIEFVIDYLIQRNYFIPIFKNKYLSN